MLNLAFFITRSRVSAACESCPCFGVVWRQTEAHGQEQRPGERRPSHPDSWRPRPGKESDATGKAEDAAHSWNNPVLTHNLEL